MASRESRANDTAAKIARPEPSLTDGPAPVPSLFVAEETEDREVELVRVLQEGEMAHVG